MRLKSRQKQVPGGYSYYIPQIPQWRPQAWSSLDSLAQQVLQVRQGNPFLTQKHGWSLDMETITNELDEWNANLQASLGNMNFVVGAEGAPAPKLKAPSQQDLSQLSAVATRARQIWSGVKTLNDWLESGAPEVTQELAETRAKTCVECPLNKAGDFSSWFTAPAASAIKKQLEKLGQRELKTSSDASLNVCEACLCPMKLKVWVPIKFIKTHTSDETLDKLRGGKNCWLISELGNA